MANNPDNLRITGLILPQLTPGDVARAVSNSSHPTGHEKPLLQRRIAAGRLFGVEAAWKLLENDSYSDITPEMASAVEPRKLAPSLFGVEVIVNEDSSGRPLGKQAVLYRDKQNKWQKLALSAEEKSVLVVSIEAYAAKGHTVVKNGRRHHQMSNPDQQAPSRAVLHVLEGKLPKMEAYLHTLKTHGEVLATLEEALRPRNRGLNRGSEITVRMKEAIFNGQILPATLDALADQRGWTREQTDQVRRTMEFRMYIDRIGSGGRHLDYNHRLMQRLLGHNSIKQYVFYDAIRRGHAYAGFHKAQLLSTSDPSV